MDTVFNYVEKGKGFFSSDEHVWITRMKKLKEKYPDEVRIIRQPEDNDGCIYVQLPTEWLQIGPKRKVNMSEEQKAIATERLRKVNAARAAQRAEKDAQSLSSDSGV